MTREILFRGKRLDNGEWITGCLVKYAYDSTPYIGYLDAWGDGIYEVDPSTVGQYTGLTANGKKIFEGDIVLRFGCCYKVCFENGQWVAVDKHGFWVELYDDVTYTVIGNIHDNPELLEGER